jgi:hypothetical protein
MSAKRSNREIDRKAGKFPGDKTGGEVGLICVQVKEDAACICSCMYVIDQPYCLCLSEIISPVRDPLSLIYEFGRKTSKKMCTEMHGP